MTPLWPSSPIASLDEALFSPLFNALAAAQGRRQCPGLSDETWLKAGVDRVLRDERSGRGFLQGYVDQHDIDIGRSTFFASLKSQRRCDLLGEVLDGTSPMVAETTRYDPFAGVSCLENYIAYAADGTYLEAATHDERKDGAKWATGHFFYADLRSHAMGHLTVADTDNNKKKEHDMHAIKRLGPNALRLGAPVGTRVIWAWDKAGIDIQEWAKAKRHGVYLISRLKENMDNTPQGYYKWDREDDINAGVCEDYQISVSGCAVRCVQYQEPATGKEFHFITLNTDLPPGVIAALYKARWDIEKAFDEIKRKMGERKSWASSSTAKTIHARFLCLTHNLVLMLERMVEFREGVVNEKENERREARKRAGIATAAASGRSFSSLVLRLLSRATQRTVIFLRWVKHAIIRPDRWESVLDRLRRAYGKR